MVRYHFSGDQSPRHRLVKCEAIWDSPPYLAPPRRVGDVWVDDLLCLAVNKLTALSRREPKDYLDLYLIERSGAYRLDRLIPLARGKDPGLDELALAGDFMAVRDLRDIARFQEDYLLVPVVLGRSRGPALVHAVHVGRVEEAGSSRMPRPGSWPRTSPRRSRGAARRGASTA